MPWYEIHQSNNTTIYRGAADVRWASAVTHKAETALWAAPGHCIIDSFFFIKAWTGLYFKRSLVNRKSKKQVFFQQPRDIDATCLFPHPNILAYLESFSLSKEIRADNHIRILKFFQIRAAKNTHRFSKSSSQIQWPVRAINRGTSD